VGLYYIVIAFFFGLATGVVARIKGSSFVVWFLIGSVLPVVGLVAAILSRWERYEPKRACPRCGATVKLADQVCMSCGHDLDWPSAPAHD
jgi:hypothetical protein